MWLMLVAFRIVTIYTNFIAYLPQDTISRIKVPKDRVSLEDMHSTPHPARAHQ